MQSGQHIVNVESGRGVYRGLGAYPRKKFKVSMQLLHTFAYH